MQVTSDKLANAVYSASPQPHLSQYAAHDTEHQNTAAMASRLSPNPHDINNASGWRASSPQVRATAGEAVQQIITDMQLCEKEFAHDTAYWTAYLLETEEVRAPERRHDGQVRTRSTEAFPVTSLQSDEEAVPKYRFHPVAIRRNVLAPNTRLNFVPYLTDVVPNSRDETRYLRWLSELDALDVKSGVKTSDSEEKGARARREERATRLSLYLDDWIRRLAVDGCTRSTLDQLAITPRMARADTTPKSGAELFTEAFDHVFGASDPPVQLRDVLFFDRSISSTPEDRGFRRTPSPQETRETSWLHKLETALGSYILLGCCICFSHSCEHGEWDADNHRQTFSVERTGGLRTLLERRWGAQAKASGTVGSEPPCNNQCYRIYDVGNKFYPVEPWTEGELQVLQATFLILGNSPCRTECEVAALLGRKCWEVCRKVKQLELELPRYEPPAKQARVEPVPWYDRQKKALSGGWRGATVAHDHARKRLIDPCQHEGPCTAVNGCPCASENPSVLCERFCRCTESTCALKFTGCACRAQGKTCLARKGDKACICLQLNRECDPTLCGGCGAGERADPENAYDEVLHSTGCQNVALQRERPKAVVLGKFQLEGCGYGLFTAEDIAAGEFVIEYTGELITHDEGVRREARRGDIFRGGQNSSYLFTLLENEGVWVDAAKYGNLSRYINHGKLAANIVPKIQYVNGEHRIKFTALRKINASEELFFNYGDEFPNLTDMILRDRAAAGQRARPGKNLALHAKDKRTRPGSSCSTSKKHIRS